MQLLMFPIVSLLYLIAAGVMNALNANKEKPSWAFLSAITNGIGTLGLIFFITLSIVSAQPFQCFMHPTGQTTVAKFMDIRCGADPKHGQLIGLGVVSIFLFVIAILGFTVHAL